MDIDIDAASRRTRMTGRGKLLLTTGIVLALVGFFFAWRDVLRIGLLLTALVALLTWLYGRGGARVDVHREVTPPRIPFGERAQVAVTVANSGSRSSQLLLAEEHVNYALGSRPRFIIPALRPGQARNVKYAISGHLRGRHTVGPLSVRQHDPFGLTRRDLVAGTAEEILVLPRVLQLPDLNPAASGTGTAGDVPLMLALHGEDDVSIRAYHEGDDLRRVHWPATAHRGDIMMRQEERPSQRRAVLILDQRAEAHFGTGAASSLEWAVTAVASAAARLHQQGFLTYLVTSGTAERGLATQPMDEDEMLYWLALAGSSSESVWRAQLEAAASLSHDQGLVVLAVGRRKGQPLLPDVEVKGATAPGLAFVIDTPHFTEPSHGSPRYAAAGHGWRTVMVREQDNPAECWTTLVAATSGHRSRR